jgi:hypothetical protein
VARKIEVESWLDKGEPKVRDDLLEWATEYLKKYSSDFKVRNGHYFKVSRDNLIFEMNHLIDEGQTIVIQNMKSAWSREKYRKKNQSNTFALSKGTHSRLRFLAKETKRSIKSTIEDLINETYWEVRNEKKAESSKRRESRYVRPSISAIFEKKFKGKELEKKDDKLSEQEDIMKKQLLRINEYQIFLVDLICDHELNEELLNLELTESQKEEALKKMSQGRK